MRMEKCSWCAPLNLEVSDSSTELVERLGSLQGFYELVHGRCAKIAVWKEEEASRKKTQELEMKEFYRI